MTSVWLTWCMVLLCSCYVQNTHAHKPSNVCKLNVNILIWQYFYLKYIRHTGNILHKLLHNYDDLLQIIIILFALFSSVLSGRCVQLKSALYPNNNKCHGIKLLHQYVKYFCLICHIYIFAMTILFPQTHLTQQRLTYSKLSTKPKKLAG